MEISISRDWMWNKLGATNHKHGCKSRFDIVIDILPSRDNVIVSENNLSVTIDPEIPP